MKNSRKWAVIRDCLRKNRVALVLLPVVILTEAAVFLLYGIMTEPLLYGAALGLFAAGILLAADLYGEYRRAKERRQADAAILTDWKLLPDGKTLEQADYRKMIGTLGQRMQEMAEDFAAQREDMLDYYTAWVHQIKTPVAVMKLYLGTDTPEHRAMRAELFRLEQYVDMVLQYMRLSSDGNDLVVEEYKIDDMVRETVRKFAGQFVMRKLKLQYIPTERTLVTDKKWFCCILEQLLSNAIKYTPAGSITIGVEGSRLYISDTGIGIAPEELPRIFEKGYTGSNGRWERSSSGLGLYLAGKAAALLHIPISVESKLGQGTTFSLQVAQPL